MVCGEEWLWCSMRSSSCMVIDCSAWHKTWASGRRLLQGEAYAAEATWVRYGVMPLIDRFLVRNSILLARSKKVTKRKLKHFLVSTVSPNYSGYKQESRRPLPKTASNSVPAFADSSLTLFLIVKVRFGFPSFDALRNRHNSAPAIYMHPATPIEPFKQPTFYCNSLRVALF
jgi:hypothetical protein